MAQTSDDQTGEDQEGRAAHLMNARRLTYLQALGVETWVRRADGILPPPAMEGIAPAETRQEASAAAASSAHNAPPAGQRVDPLSIPPTRMMAPAARSTSARQSGLGAPACAPDVAPQGACGPDARQRVADRLDARQNDAGRDAANPHDAGLEPAGHDAEGIARMGWQGLEQAVRNCTRCALHATRTQGVFGVGNRQARWMIIGEAPGAEEDRQGEPFVGRAGQLLTTMLRAAGLSREEVFIANILKSRPPGNRDPKPEEARACLPYLYRQIELIDPVIILCVGRIAAQTLLQSAEPIGRLRGKLHHLGVRPMVVTYHPAYLLRSPGEKRKSWADLVLAMRAYEQSERSERSEDHAGH